VHLTCNPGDWSNSPDFTYQGRRDGVPITGATFPSYQPKRTRQAGTGTFLNGGDGNHQISCAVTATNDIGASTAASNSVLAIDDIPFATDRPQLTFGQQIKASYVGTTAAARTGCSRRASRRTRTASSGSARAPRSTAPRRTGTRSGSRISAAT
jgi:hypothetical protein